jgi:hypothetical protein
MLVLHLLLKKRERKKKTIEVSYIGHTCIDIGSIVHVQTMPRTQGHLPAMERGKKKKIKHRLDVSLQGLLSPDAHGMIAQKRSCEAVL